MVKAMYSLPNSLIITGHALPPQSVTGDLIIWEQPSFPPPLYLATPIPMLSLSNHFLLLDQEHLLNAIKINRQSMPSLASPTLSIQAVLSDCLKLLEVSECKGLIVSVDDDTIMGSPTSQLWTCLVNPSPIPVVWMNRRSANTIR